MKKLDAIDTQLISASCQISVFSFGCKEYMNLESASMHQRYAGKHRNGKLAKQDFCQYYAKSALKGESFVMVNKAVNFMTICLHFISGSIFCDSSHQAQSAARRLLDSASQLGFATTTHTFLQFSCKPYILSKKSNDQESLAKCAPFWFDPLQN